MRPEVSFEDLRNATGNTGNVEENKSLYWNPAIYKVVNPRGDDTTFEIVDVWFASAYYIFRTGQATAFPRGLKMKASDVDAPRRQELARARAVCAGRSSCQRGDAGGCKAYRPSDQGGHGFLPTRACDGMLLGRVGTRSLLLMSNLVLYVAELEINIKFPTCWDGVNAEATGGATHVVYADECDGKEHNECFDFACPASHPVKLPEIHLYVRVLGYEGGAHMFADGTDVSSEGRFANS